MGSTSQMRAEEFRNPAPAVDGGIETVRGTVDGEERMPCAVVGKERVILSQPGEFRVEGGDRFGGRVAVVLAEQAEQRAAQIRRQPEDGLHRRWHPLRWILYDERSVAVDGGVDRQRACGQECVAAT